MDKNKNNIYINVKDFLVTGESFDLLFDQEKEMLITSPQPNENSLPQYYESEEYISHTDSKKGVVASLYQLVKRYSLRKKVGLVSKLNNGTGLLLDIGAGTGDFLFAAKNAGWEVQGVEVNENARSLSQNKGILLKQAIDDFEGKQFDVVTLWHVLEHLPHLDETVLKIENLVKPGGSLVIAVPNFNSYDALRYKSFWAAYDAPRHLWHFSRKSIPMIFSNSFELNKIKPMIFDSFYVSLLSEKYKTGNSFSIKALLVGFWSNIKAWNSNEYSSLIYCLRKS